MTASEHTSTHFVTSRDLFGRGHLHVTCSCAESWTGSVEYVDESVRQHLTASEHTLVRDGRPHWRVSVPFATYDAGTGRGLCTCGWLSDVPPTTEARRSAHAQYITEEIR